MINKRRRRNTKASRRRKIAYWKRRRKPKQYESPKWTIAFNEKGDKKIW